MEPLFTDIHTHAPDAGSGARSVLSVRLREPGVPYPAPPTLFSAGIHPWDCQALSGQDKERLYGELEADPALIAIGETGLDYACGVDRTLQQECFERQLDIAARRGLPVVLHCVRAFEPVMKTLGRFALRAVIFHGFTGSPQQAARAAGAGSFLSFGERSLRSPKTVEALRVTPHERIFLETDDSGLPIRAIYAQTASALGMDVHELARVTDRNYKMIFG